MDVRERRFLVEEAARAQTVRQLLAIEAASYQHLEKKAQTAIDKRLRDSLRTETQKKKQMKQSEIYAANRAKINRSLRRLSKEI
jgi:hypothetical protein